MRASLTRRSHSVAEGRTGTSEWKETVASFRNGKKRWRVDFYGYLVDGDHARLSDAGIVHVDGQSEIGPGGELREGLARNYVEVEAESLGHGRLIAVGTRLEPTEQRQ